MSTEPFLSSLFDARQREAALDTMSRLIEDIYPYCRSITGPGVRQTLSRVQQDIALEVHEVPSGTPVFDWTVPDEWTINEAWIANSHGKRVVDFADHSLHVVGYSEPIHARMRLDALRAHLHTLPDRPDWIPYRTSYYRRTWGFCLTHRQLEALPDGEYDVRIDSRIEPGSLTYAEHFVPGATREEILISTHICHPSLANDNCTGIATLAALASALGQSGGHHFSYRLLFAPGTIGAITWLARNEAAVARIVGGLVIGLLGDPGSLTYKRSRQGDSAMDRIASDTLLQLDPHARVEHFSPYGYDERQYCSPGIDLAVGRLTRSANEAYAEYHTSADNLSLLRREALGQSLLALATILRRFEANTRYVNRIPKCEPRLGKRGLFRSVGGRNPGELEYAYLWLLNQSDGRHGIRDIAAVSGLPVDLIEAAAASLVEAGLLAPAEGSEQQ